MVVFLRSRLASLLVVALVLACGCLGGVPVPDDRIVRTIPPVEASALIEERRAEGCDDPTGQSLRNPRGFEPELEKTRSVFEQTGGDPGFVVIDVRRPDEFAIGHIPGATNIASANFSEHLSSLDPEGTYLIYCQRGGRSAAVRELMREAGFREVYEIEGGIDAWTAAGFPVAGA